MVVKVDDRPADELTSEAVRERLEFTRQLQKTGDLVEDFEPPLVAGVDLGTSNIQVIVLDSTGQPVLAGFCWDESVRDGIVLDYNGARQKVLQFKNEFEQKLGEGGSLDYAAVGYPPGTEAWVESNVVKDCQFEIIAETAEPTAAAAALEIEQGVIVDVGGGTTGISVIKNGEIVHSADEATGGHHLTLTIAGNRDLTYDQAEKYKLNESFSTYRGIVQPVVEKMASIVQTEITAYPEVEEVYLVGGTVIPEGMEDIFADLLRRRVIKPPTPILITPLGIACSGLNNLNTT